MNSGKFVVNLMQKTALAPLNIETPRGGVRKSFDSKQEAVQFADENRKLYNKRVITFSNEDDIICE